MRALLFDLDGVLYQSDRVIEGAIETLQWCERRKIPHLFVTNTSSKPRGALVERLSTMGLSVSAQQIFAPPIAARDYLAAHDATPLALFVREATREDFAGLEVLDDAANEGAGSVVIGDIGAAWNFATLNRAFRLLMAEPRPVLVALGMSRYAQGQRRSPVGRGAVHQSPRTRVRMRGGRHGQTRTRVLRCRGSQTRDVFGAGRDDRG